MKAIYPTVAGTVALVLAPAPAAWAQEQPAVTARDGVAEPQAGDGAIDAEIVVTAARQGAQGLSKVPLAIQAFSGEQLERRGVRETGDLLQAVPGASRGEQVGSVIQTFTLRGVGAGAVGDSPIGYYIDDVPFAIVNFPLAPPLRLLDLDRVEVLRGPQGTLYGQGSAGGTIIYHTRDPDLDRVEARGMASIAAMRDAGGPNWGVSGAVSVPIVPGKLALRVSGGYDRRAGYIDVYRGGPGSELLARDANPITNRDIRAVLMWKPDEALTVRAQAYHFEPSQRYTQSIDTLRPARLYNTGGTRGFENGNFDLYSLSVNYDAGFATLSSATSYLDAKFGYLAGLRLGVLGFGTLVNTYDAYGLAQEVRLTSNGAGPLHWLAGGFYQKGRGTFGFDAKVQALTADGYTAVRTSNYSAFGELSYDLFGGRLVPLVGLRYYRDTRTLDSAQNVFGNASKGGARARPDKLTWRANLSWHPSDAVTAFVTASTGFRSGINQTALQVGALRTDGLPATQSLAPDSLTNYEAGVKARLADGRLQLGANLYRIEFRDFQQGLTTTSGIDAFTSIGDARATGLDLEAQWRTPLKGLNLGAVANWNDTEFTDVVAAITPILPSIRNGARMVNTTKHNYRLDANWEGELGGALRGFATAAATFTSDRIMTDGYRVPAYALYDASLGVRTGRWEVALFGENLGDERGPSFVRGSARFAGPFPRTIGLRLRVDVD